MAKLITKEEHSGIGTYRQQLDSPKPTDSEHLKNMHFDVAHAVAHLEKNGPKDHPTVQYALTFLKNALMFHKDNGNG